MEGDPRPKLRLKHVRQLEKTEMCGYFLSSGCRNGARCGFAHSLAELREKPDLNCTSMCKSFLRTGTCNNPVCTFAHDERELRTTAGFFKTKLCKFAVSGRCKHGSACRFAHAEEELAVSMPSQSTMDRGSTGGIGLAMDPSAPSSADGLSSATGRGRQTSAEDASSTVSGSSNSGSHPMNPEAESFANQGDHDTSAEPPEFPMESAGSVGNSQSTTRSSNDWADIISDQSNRESRESVSDQSTRVDTGASLSTPIGSGESGEEAASVPQGGVRSFRSRAQTSRMSGDRALGKHCTTVMLSNVPNFLTQGAVVSMLEDLTVCMRGAFDFFYCPWDPYQDRNLGYAIINFYSRSVAVEFERMWVNQPLLPKTHGTKRLSIVPAALQGRAAQLRHFSAFNLAHHEDPRFRPLVRAAPDEPLQPMATSEDLLRASQHFRQREAQQTNRGGGQNPNRAAWGTGGGWAANAGEGSVAASEVSWDQDSGRDNARGMQPRAAFSQQASQPSQAPMRRNQRPQHQKQKQQRQRQQQQQQQQQPQPQPQQQQHLQQFQQLEQRQLQLEQLLEQSVPEQAQQWQASRASAMPTDGMWGCGGDGMGACPYTQMPPVPQEAEVASMPSTEDLKLQQYWAMMMPQASNVAVGVAGASAVAAVSSAGVPGVPQQGGGAGSSESQISRFRSMNTMPYYCSQATNPRAALRSNDAYTTTLFGMTRPDTANPPTDGWRSCTSVGPF